MKFFACVVFLVASLPLQGQVRLPNALSDHAVLQREAPIHLWGWARPEKELTIHFHEQTVSIRSNTLGEWSAYLQPEHAGGPFTLNVEGDGSTQLNDLLVGDVWLASGQSNMEMPLAGFATAPLRDSSREIAAATRTRVRLLHVANTSADTPQPDNKGKWAECTPQTAASFSAIGYFFAVKISEQEDVPVGVIDATWGGTPADAWMSMDTLGSNAQLHSVFMARANFADGEMQRQERGVLDMEADATAKATNSPLPAHGWRPNQRGWVPASLYDGMIAPLVPMSIKGVIWYQGETNSQSDRYRDYATLFPALITDWRNHFEQGDFPFLFAQISSFISPPEHWGVVRDAQRRALSLRNTAMAVTLDVGDPHNVHPADKQTVAARLASAALGMVYGEHISYRSPALRRVTDEGSKLRVWFDDAEGLNAHGPLREFEVAGADHHFVPAAASIDRTTVLVSSSQISRPIYVRYAWANDSAGSLYNAAGLPAGTFTSERVPHE